MDENGNFIPPYVEQYLQDDIALLIPEAIQPTGTKFWFANGLADNVSPYPIALAFKDTLDKYGWDYEFYTYAGGHFDVGEPMAEAFRFIDGVWKEKLETQTLEVEQGWSFISSYLMLANPALDDIFEVPNSNEQIIFAMNSNGIYWPGQNVNTMNFWWTKKAIKIKAAETFSMDISGVMYEDKTVQLLQGINYMPVLSNEPVEAAAIFNQIGNENLHYAFDITNMLVYWPAGELFTLNELLPGSGYMVNSYIDTEVDFGNVGKCSHPEKIAKTNQPQKQLNTGMQHLIVIAPEALADICSGSIIAIENGTGRVICSTKMDDAALPLILTAHGDDPTTAEVEGFLPGEQMALVCLDPQTLEFTPLMPEFDTEIGLTNLFADWGISKITALKNSTGIIDSGKPDNISISPNPTHNKISINWNNTQDSQVTIKLLNLHGQYMETIVSDSFSPGPQNLTWPCAHLAEGIYFITINTNTSTQTRKLMILK